jgi:formate-dependent nitrite reductase membrane component NrfD
MPRFFEDFKELVDNREDFKQMLIGSQRYLVILIVIELALVVIELGTGHGTALLTTGSLSTTFFAYVILGLILPLGIAYYSEKGKHVGRYSMLVPVNIFGFILILIGGFLLRYVILTAGQIIA